MKFSLLTACMNKRDFIMDCYHSVLAQTFTDWEWIVVDDHSTDRSEKILRRVRSTGGPRLNILFSRKRLFCSNAYQLALRHAKGEIVGILDMDDTIAPHAMKHVVQLYDKNPDLGYIYTQHNVYNKRLKKKIKNGVSSTPDPGKSFVDMTFEKRHCFSHWRTFRRSIANQTPVPLFPPGLKRCVDKNMGFVLEETAPGGFYNNVCYTYRWYLGNMTSKAPGGSSKKLWRAIATEYDARRRAEGVKTFPVREIKL